jgi:polar amino acid transport system substrate-binding protein
MRSFTVAALLVVAGAGPARADAPKAAACNALPTLRAIACRHVLRVGMFPGLMPFVAADADAVELARLSHGDPPLHAVGGRAVAGFDVDLAAAAARALDVELRVTLVDRFDDLLPGLADNRYDFVLSGLTRTLDRARTVAFSDPYFTSGLLVLVRDGSSAATVQSLTQAHARVAVRAGTTAESFARRTLAGVVVRPVATDASMFAAIERGEADAIVADYVNTRDAEVRGRVHVALTPLEDRRFTVEHFAFAVRQGDRDWLGWLNLMLRESKAAGEFHTLAARYNAWFRSER